MLVFTHLKPYIVQSKQISYSEQKTTIINNGGLVSQMIDLFHITSVMPWVFKRIRSIWLNKPHDSLVSSGYNTYLLQIKRDFIDSIRKSAQAHEFSSYWRPRDISSSDFHGWLDNQVDENMEYICDFETDMNDTTLCCSWLNTSTP